MLKQNQSGTKISNYIPTKLLASFIFLALFCQTAISQVSTKKLDNILVSSSKAKLLGKTKTVRESISKPSTSHLKRQARKIERKMPNDFKGRKNASRAVYLDKEHQGVDPVLQSELRSGQTKQIEVLANLRGLGERSPIDPTGDVSTKYFVQGTNSTQVGVYNRDGSLEMSFNMNTLWAQFNIVSGGDPIVLYDEINDRWILTEFASQSNNLLIAISETNDPLGSYFSYAFATPNFPDYPKYAITPDHLMVTTNEQGSDVLHHYFLDKNALIAGAESVDLQRLSVVGTNNSEQPFIVATPVDWNGANLPFDTRPMSVRLNDSSWGEGADQDQIELYRFDIDFSNVDNTTIEQTSIVTAPFDAFPCTLNGPGFACIPQMGGDGVDGVPEVIMNLPNYRNFGSHESIVLSFITDATDGNNRAGIRWTELRRTSDTDWDVYQEGTFAPDDGLNRFMCSVAIDDRGNICLGYNVSSADSFVGIRATGRNASDPLGQMTFDELIIREGEGPTTFFGVGRFSDYSQMSAVGDGSSEFWYTGEYAGPSGSITNITSMSLGRDSFDLALRSFLTPTVNSSEFTATETVTVEVVNSGINTIDSYDVGLVLNGAEVDVISIDEAIESDEIREHTFTSTIDLSQIGEYGLSAHVTASNDENPLNDTLRAVITQLPSIEGQLTGIIGVEGCDQFATSTLTLRNLGGSIITNATIGITVNGVSQDDIEFEGSLSFQQAREFDITISDDLVTGDNEIVATILTLNGESNDFDANNNEVRFNASLLDDSSFITVSITTDNFAGETSYNISDQNTGEILFERDVFPTSNTTFTDMVCLAEGACLTFTIFDAYGDGICCGYGEGSITIFDLDGVPLVMNNGEFGSVLEIDFCNTPGVCNLTAEINTTIASSDSSLDGSIMITPTGIGPFEYSIDGGTTFQNESTFDSLQAGEYEIIVLDQATGCEYTEIVTIEFNTVSTYFVGDVSVEVNLIPNPTDGVFQITVDNLPTNENFLDIVIYDIQGKLIQERQIGKYNNQFIGTFSLYAYPAGNYLIRVKSEGNNFLEKIVKQ